MTREIRLSNVRSICAFKAFYLLIKFNSHDIYRRSLQKKDVNEMKKGYLIRRIVILAALVIFIILMILIVGHDYICRNNLSVMYAYAARYAAGHDGTLPATIRELSLPFYFRYCAACDFKLHKKGIRRYVSSYYFIPKRKRLSEVGDGVLFRDSSSHGGGFRYVDGRGQVKFLIGEEFPWIL